MKLIDNCEDREEVYSFIGSIWNELVASNDDPIVSELFIGCNLADSIIEFYKIVYRLKK